MRPATKTPDGEIWQLALEAGGGASMYSTDKERLRGIAEGINRECPSGDEEEPPAMVLPTDETSRGYLRDSIENGDVLRDNELFIINPWKP